MPAPSPWAFRLYAGLAPLLAPLVARRVRRRLGAQDVPPERQRERLGHASLPRPEGALVWLHAASVGESLSTLPLIEAMAAARPGLSFLITSGTATSARLLADRMPPRCRHQYAPIDSRAALARFHAHWRPDLAIFVESELWPLMLSETAARGVPMALLNARLSQGSLRNWARIPASAAHLLGLFSLILAQGEDVARRLVTLGADPSSTRAGSDLKAAAAPPPHDPAEAEALARALGARPAWFACSTHPGEEDAVLAAHRALRATRPDLLLVLMPRHPERGGEIAALLAAQGFATARRSLDEVPDADHAVYLADTLGETGLFYATVPLVFLGGSLGAAGGHNPYEAAHAGAALLHGPRVANAAATYAAYDASGGARCVQDASGLAAAVAALLDDPAEQERMRAASRGFAADARQSLSQTVAALLELMAKEEATT